MSCAFLSPVCTVSNTSPRVYPTVTSPAQNPSPGSQRHQTPPADSHLSVTRSFPDCWPPASPGHKAPGSFSCLALSHALLPPSGSPGPVRFPQRLSHLCSHFHSLAIVFSLSLLDWAATAAAWNYAAVYTARPPGHVPAGLGGH